MTDRTNTIEQAFGSIEAFVTSGEKYCRRSGMFGQVCEDMVSEYCVAGFDAAGRVDDTKDKTEAKAFISARARGAVKDFGRDNVFQKRTTYKTGFISLDANIGEETMTMHDTLDGGSATPFEALTTQEEKKRLAIGLATLEETHRGLIEATLDGQTIGEIAAQRGVSKQSISKSHARAVENLRKAVA